MNLKLLEIDKEQNLNNKNYLLRGIVSFKLNHYCCYFFYPENNFWLLLDDTFKKKFGSLGQILRNMVEKAEIPAILLYQESNQEFTVIESFNSFVDEVNCFNCNFF